MYPVIYQFGPFVLQTAGLFLLIGAITTVYFFLGYVQKKKNNISFIFNNFWWIIIGSLIGGRLVYILTRLDEYKGNMKQTLYIWDGNIDFYGSLFFFILTLIILCFRNKEPFWKWFDNISLSTLLLLAFSSIGDFFSGSNYGSPPTVTFVPQVTFDSINVPYTIPLHPVQLYDAFFLFALFFLLHRFFRYKRKEGVIALLCVMGYFCIEFFMEFLRGTFVSHFYGYRVPQIIDFFIFTLVFILLIVHTHRKALDFHITGDEDTESQKNQSKKEDKNDKLSSSKNVQMNETSLV